MLKVLVVDDAATDRIRVAGIAAKWRSCEVLQAENGQSAVDVVASELPDIVLTDLNMPEMDGLQLVTAIRDGFPHIPVVLMTADGSEEMAARALKKGAASYVPKKRLSDDLLDTLDHVYSTSKSAHTLSRLMHYMTETKTQFVLPNDPSLLKICLDRLISMLRCLPLGDEMERVRVGIALREAISNAYFHGNLEVVDDDFEGHKNDWHRIASSRWYEAPYCERKISLHADINRKRAVFVIADDGDGFDLATEGGEFTPLSDHGLENSESGGAGNRAESPGRGQTLMKSIMDEVTYNEAGNEVRMVKYAVQMDDDLEDEADPDAD
ncbi:MAG: response regulator [Fuerstiella sp.]